MTLMWSIVEPDGLEDDIFREELIAEAWHLWELTSCVERNGGHLWVAYLDGNMFDDGVAVGGYVYLTCEGCPATISDLYPDASDFLEGEVGGVEIDGGRHLSAVDVEAPVRLVLHVEEYVSMNSITPEVDVWLEVTDR